MGKKVIQIMKRLIVQIFIIITIIIISYNHITGIITIIFYNSLYIFCPCSLCQFCFQIYENLNTTYGVTPSNSGHLI